MHRRRLPLLITLLLSAATAAAEPLSLAESERIALESDPTVARQRALGEAFGAEAVAERQLPDPRLRFGLESLPTDPLSVAAEPMTQLRVGVMQEFPRGDTRAIQGRTAEARGALEHSRGDDQALRALQGVRESYLDAWFQQRALEAMAENRTLFAKLVDITQAQYAAGRDNRQDVLGAKLELSLLDDRLSAMRAEEEQARAELARWIGVERAQEPLATQRPTLPEPAAAEALIARLPEHPRLRSAAAQVQVSDHGVELARQSYKPGFEVELSYGKRFGQEEDGQDRADLLSAMVTMDLPLFPGKRQDQRVAARAREAQAMRLERDDLLRELRSELLADHAQWRRLRERSERYRRELLPQAEQNAEAAAYAYQNQVTPFPDLLRAYMNRIETRLELLRLEADETRARARIAYFAGETP